jgi:glycosyltransferase involved in cell wall biosynthesis
LKNNFINRTVKKQSQPWLRSEQQVENSIEFSFTGNERIYSQRLFNSIKDTFTYELWVKPDAVHEIADESRTGVSGISGQRYIINPEHGGEITQAGIGISIGINGVSVYEHTDNHLPASLVYPSLFEDWVHVAVVYQDRTPYLFINGQFIKKGLKSTMDTVYASGIFGGIDSYGSFVGKLRYIRLWDHARSEAQIRENMYKDLTGQESGLFGIWNFQCPRENADGILFINHSSGGGTEHYQELLIEKMQHESRIFKLRCESDFFYIEHLSLESPLSYNLRFKTSDPQAFKFFCSLLGIELIYINHFYSLPLFKIMDMVQFSGIDYIFFIHDFYCACPSYNLINSKGVYCHSETNLEICQNCMDKTGLMSWRVRFNSFLLKAKNVLAPSCSTKDIIQKYYPNISIDVQEHSLPNTIKYTFNPQFIEEKVLNIAFIGYLHYSKGLNILNELKNMIQQENLPINTKVLGSTPMEMDYFISDDGKYMVTGPYKNSEISNLLAKHKIALVVIPSIWPETFSYVTGEAMVSGYPIITFNFGAPAERVKKYDGGWIVDSINSNDILHLLTRLIDNLN